MPPGLGMESSSSASSSGHAIGSGVVIRLYAPADRTALRRICCDTANRGEPMEGSAQDGELFADLVTRYYTDYEPQSTWVAEYEGRVVGYVTGCLDSRRHGWVMTWRVVPAAILHAIGRGALGSGHAWRWLGAGMRTWLAGGFDRRTSLRYYLAHLHVNIEQRFRGLHVGRQLVEQFCAQAQRAGLRGVHAAIREDNASARALFERLGFTVISRHPAIRPEGAAERAGHTLIYGRQW